MLRQTLLVALLAFVAAAAQTAMPPVVTERGGLVCDAVGRAVYVSDADRHGRVSCGDTCTATWPPFLAAIGAQPTGQLSVHLRDDGRMQWGWAGRPLYYFAGDLEAGRASGDGAEGVWHAVPFDKPTLDAQAAGRN